MKDRLFVMWNCPECAKIKQALKEEAIYSDDFRGKDGRQLFVLYAFSNDGCRDLLDTFGLRDKYTPVLQTVEGAVLESVHAILAYLRLNGLAD